jgi:hypothetical protein
MGFDWFWGGLRWVDMGRGVIEFVGSSGARM